MEQNPSWEADSSSASQEIFRILWNVKFTPAHKSPPLALSCISWVHSTPPILVHFILIIFSHLRSGLPNNILPSNFPTKTLYAPLLLPHTCHLPCPSYSSWFHHLDFIWWEVQFISFLIGTFLHFPVTSSPLDSSVFHSTLFLNTAAYVSLSVWETIFDTHIKPEAKLWLYVFTSLYFWRESGKSKDCRLNASKHSQSSFCA